MPQNCSRRIVRHAVMVLAGVVLLPVVYVSSAVSLAFADTAGWLPPSVVEIVGPAYYPLGWYLESGYPGSDAIQAVADVAIEAGERVAGR